MISKRKLLNLVHLIIIAPLLWALATNKIPENYKQYIVYLAILFAIYHLYVLLSSNSEGMTQINGSNMHYVKIFDSVPGFDTPEITVKKGDIVVWTNIGELEHSITGDNNEFNSGYLKPGQNFSVKFDFPGDFSYHCIHHKGWMKGVVYVK